MRALKLWVGVISLSAVMACPLWAQEPVGKGDAVTEENEGYALGEIKKIEASAGSLTLKHGYIKSANMPGMTMSYRVQSPQMLEHLAVGDKIRFDVKAIHGVWTITYLKKA